MIDPRTMTPATSAEWELRVPIVFETAVSVAGEHDGRDIDAVVARDGQGRAIVPGTSWTGVLRALSGLTGDPAWGSTDSASVVTVLDSVIVGAAAEVRDGIGIDRRSGTAASGVKFTREVIPAGSTTELVVRYRGEAEEAKDARAFLQQIVDAVRAGEVGVGAMRTRGLGRVALGTGAAMLRDRSPLARLGGASTADEALTAQERPARAHVTLEFATRGPVMVASGSEGVEIDRLPLVTAVTSDGDVALVIPGSSLKGALRSQAERIWRTVTDAPSSGTNFLEQIRVDAANGPVSRLFGRAPEGSDAGGAFRPGRRGGASFPDVFSKVRVKPDAWRNLVAGRSESGSEDHLRAAQRVAIDRWTGGAAEGLLFSTLEPSGTLQWEPVRIDLDVDRLDDTSLALLALVLRDLVEGWIPIGFAANRTGGELRVTACTISVGRDRLDISDADGDMSDVEYDADGKLGSLDVLDARGDADWLPGPWLAAWREAVDEAIKNAKNAKSGDPVIGGTDG